jgi:glycosyltransferase involved in cell wall biosynthesis
MTPSILFLLKGYPRLSETFIAQEILSLEKAGFRLRIVAMRRPVDDRVHPVHREIEAAVDYLPEYLHHEPWRVLRSLARTAFRRGFPKAAARFLHDLFRDPTRNRIRRFGQALVLAAELPDDVARIHAHFIHTPASVARYASMMTGVIWSCSAHAKDIWTTPDWDLAEKLAESQFTVTCTGAGRDRLAALSAPGKPVRLIYHGLDLNRFPSLMRRLTRRDGQRSSEPVSLLTVARAVEKKGLDVLIQALAALPHDVCWRWMHVGGGALEPKLKLQAERLGVADRCVFLGARDQNDVLERYREADIFVLPCRVADDGDRDGLPNVLIEAASQGLALISTPVSGVPELIEHDVDGVLTPAGDVEALTGVLLRLIADPETRRRHGEAAMRKVRRGFDHDRSMIDLVRLLDGGAANRSPSTPVDAINFAE